MIQNKSIFDTLVAIKRSGQRTEFNGEKIAIAIKKSFDSVDAAYNREDANKVYSKVLSIIEKDYQDRKTIKIEDIQDIIEEQLKNLHFKEVYESFASYREQRAASRETFAVKGQHKFLKAIESLGLSTDKEGLKPDMMEDKSSSEVIYNFGTIISREFAKAYLLDSKYVRAHDSGIIHIHQLDFLPMGTTGSMQLELDRLFKNGFFLGSGNPIFPDDIYEYGYKASYIIEAAMNDQHGCECIGAFDYYMATGVLKSFKKNFKKQLKMLVKYQDLLDFINLDRIEKEIDKLESMEMNLSTFEYVYKNSKVLKRLFLEAYLNATQETKEDTHKAMQNFIESLNTLYARGGISLPVLTINFGTDSSIEGRMVIECILNVLGEKTEPKRMIVHPTWIFKVKEGINYGEEDPNYDMFERTILLAEKTFFIHFSFLDAPFNKSLLKGKNYRYEVNYTKNGERVAEDITSPEMPISGGKGNLSSTSIDLPRIAIKHGICLKERCSADMESFYHELADTMDIMKDQLLERFEMQCSKHSYNFPFLIGQGIWCDGEKVKETDRLRKILKHGTMSLNFVGLAEALTALMGKHHGESEDALQLGILIVSFMRNRVDAYGKQYNLNFTLSGIDHDIERERFMNIDKTIYGKIKNVTDREYYSHSFHVPEEYSISLPKKIEKEGLFHKYTNGGHVCYIDLSKETKLSLQKIIWFMKENQIGYAYIEKREKEI